MMLWLVLACFDNLKCDPPAEVCDAEKTIWFKCDSCGNAWGCYVAGERPEWHYSDVSCDCVDSEGNLDTDSDGCQPEL